MYKQVMQLCSKNRIDNDANSLQENTIKKQAANRAFARKTSIHSPQLKSGNRPQHTKKNTGTISVFSENLQRN
jgi:hypothetical protein